MFKFNINDIKPIDNLNQELIIKYYNGFEDFLGYESKIIFNDYALLGYTSSRYKRVNILNILAMVSLIMLLVKILIMLQ